MSDFVCTVGTRDGSVVEKIFAGETRLAVRQHLEAQGYSVFQVRRGGAALQLPRRGPRRLKASEFLVVNREFASLVRAGMPMLSALGLLQGRRAGTRLGDMLDRVRTGVEGGASLSEAFGAESELVSPLYVATIGVGEASGDLDGALRRYSAYLERAIDLRKRVQGAVVYPTILIGLAAVTVTILLTYVMPRFANFYASYQAELPFLTRMLLSSSSLVAQLWPLWLALLAAAAFAGAVWMPTPTGRAFVGRIVLATPLIGRLQRLYLGVQVTRTLSVLLRGGTPMLPALQATRKAIDHPIFRARLGATAEQIRGGAPLYQALESNDLLDPLAIEMIQVGESTGELDRMLEEVADHYDEVLDTQLQRAVTLLEPALLVGIGLIVAAIVLAVYLPLFRVVEAVG